MDTFLFIGTSTGIRTCKRERKAWSLQHRAAIMKEVTSLSASQGAVLAGTRDGILRSDNLGKKWEIQPGIGYPVRALAAVPPAGTGTGICRKRAGRNIHFAGQRRIMD